MKKLAWLVPPLALVLSSCPAPRVVPRVDPAIETDIAGIKAIDNHAHPMRVFGEGEKDDEYDALPVELMEPAPSGLLLRPENPAYAAASKTLYGDNKKKVMREKGDGYSAWVLDRLGIEIMLANRITMGRGLTHARFRWVPFSDALMYPLRNDGLASRNPDYKVFYPAEEKLLGRYVAESGLATLPKRLDEYCARVVTPTLGRWKSGGAVAIKFEAAYLRSLDFGEVLKLDADRIYAAGGQPLPDQYKKLQDYIFRYIAREAGRLGLAVHLHACAGAGGYFGIAGANPMLLEPLFNDPSLRKTNFVIVHGGWPFTREVTALLAKANAYADFSDQTFTLYPETLSHTLREWIEFMPEKILFGTDASPITPEVSWEETGMFSADTARRALGLALTGMLRDGEITRERAGELARMVLRENAIKLYGLK